LGVRLSAPDQLGAAKSEALRDDESPKEKFQSEAWQRESSCATARGYRAKNAKRGTKIAAAARALHRGL
jgi:hypothetical protein